MGEKRTEKVIVWIYSVYALVMSVAAMLLAWPAWIVPLAAVGLVSIWYIYLREVKDYRFRAFLYATLCLVNLSVYGLMSSSFVCALCVLCVLVILLAFFNIPEIVYLEVFFSLFLIAYHGLVYRTIPMDTTLDFLRFLVQVVSLFIIELLTYMFIKTHRDTNLKLQEVIQDLKVAEQSKNDFLANISHEIRTPINTVCGMSEMILREDISDTVREDTFNIQAAGRNLLATVSDVLDFSELEAGKMELVEEPYNLTSTINDIINMAIAQKGSKKLELIVDCDAKIPYTLLGDEQKIRRVILNFVNNAIKFTEKGCVTISFAGRKEAYGINLMVKVKDTGIGIAEENLEKLFSSFNQVDTKRNRQEGGIGVGLAIAKKLINKMEGFISVKSELGKGSEFQFVIPQKVMDERPMVAVNDVQNINIIGYINSEKYEFTEIRDDYMRNIKHMVEGLEVRYQSCRNLMEFKRRMEKEIYTHAFITVEEYQEDEEYFDRISEQMIVVLLQNRDIATMPGGNIKVIYKPFYVLSIAAVLNGDYTLQRLDGSHYLNKKFIAPEASVLVVDDNLMNLKVVEGLLRPYKIKVFVATSGKECLSKLENSRYDIIFMDHMMPEMDGVETAHKIRAKAGNYFQNVPIVALTANAIGGAREMFLEEGFQDYVAKPIELSHMERVLRKYIPKDKLIKAEDVEFAPEEEKKPVKVTAGVHIDRRRGLQYCGNNEQDYEDILKVYLSTGLQKIKEIREKYESKDWKNYTILVHALKSTSIGIGATNLGEMAKALEAAGKTENLSYIREHHEEVMQEYEEVLLEIGGDNIRKSLAAEYVETMLETEAVEEVLKEELAADAYLFHLKDLVALLETFEMETVENKIALLSEYSYAGKNLEEVLKPVREHISQFDFMTASEFVTGLLAEGGAENA